MRSNLPIFSLLFFLTACGGGGSNEPMARAVNDTANVDEDSSVTTNVLANDVDVSATTLAISQAPVNGSATVMGNSIQYTPDADYNGPDTIRYTVSSSTNAVLSAVLTITVNDINDLPVAVADSFIVPANIPTVLDILGNDSDPDGSLASAAVTANPINGSVQVTGSTITYTPTASFSGADLFSYQAIDDDVGLSNIVMVSITVDPSINVLTVSSLPVPQTSYMQLNNAELGATVLTSPNQSFTVPQGAISFSLTLQGNDVAEGGLFISGLIDPNGLPISPLDPNAVFCDMGLCSALVPRSPEFIATRGVWQYNLGTLQADLSGIDLNSVTVNLALRTGPEIDLSNNFPAQLNIKTFLTANTVDTDDIALVLTQLEAIANANNIAINLDSVTRVTNPRFTEVSSDFNNTDTAALVSMGDADQINIFFIESFSGLNTAGLVGISAGLPGPMGIKGKYNGILLDADITRESATDAFYARTMAEFTLHEIGHFLGLYHTTEQLFVDGHDVLLDTPECDDTFDSGSTGTPGVADIEECPDGLNIMFWSNDLNGVKQPLSNDQRQAIYYAPIAVP